MSMGAVQMAAGMAISLVSIKITSKFLGPEGTGIVGQLTYVMSIANGCLALGASTGIVRRMDQLAGDGPRLALATSSVSWLMLACGVPVAIAMALFAPWIAAEPMSAPGYGAAVVAFAGTYMFGLLAAVPAACAIGSKDYRSTTIANVGIQFAAFVATAIGVVAFGLAGGLAAAVLTPVLTLGVWYGVGRDRPWWPRRMLAHGYSWDEARATLSFVPKAVITSIGMPLLQLLVTNTVEAASGKPAMGWLRNVNRLSDMMLTLCGGLFTMYFLPRFTEIQKRAEMRRELSRTGLLIVPTMAIVAFGIWLFRDTIIIQLFREDFAPMRDLFGWQMAGTVFKIASWILAYVLLAKLSGTALAVLEGTSIAVMLITAKLMIGEFGVVGAPMAMCCTYAAYTVVVGLLVLRVLRRMP